MNKLQPYADAILGASALTAVAFGVTQAPQWAREQTAANHLSAMDQTLAYQGDLQAKYTKELQAKKPDVAQQLISSCSDQLAKCLADMQIPEGKPCERYVGMDAMKFHNSTPHEAGIVSFDPDRKECELQVESLILKCQEQATYCLERPLR